MLKRFSNDFFTLIYPTIDLSAPSQQHRLIWWLPVFRKHEFTIIHSFVVIFNRLYRSAFLPSHFSLFSPILSHWELQLPITHTCSTVVNVLISSNLFLCLYVTGANRLELLLFLILLHKSFKFRFFHCCSVLRLSCLCILGSSLLRHHYFLCSGRRANIIVHCISWTPSGSGNLGEIILRGETSKRLHISIRVTSFFSPGQAILYCTPVAKLQLIIVNVK